MNRKTVDNIVEISFAFRSLAENKMLQLSDDGTTSEQLKEEILSWAEEFEQEYDETGDYQEKIWDFAYEKFEQAGWLQVNTKITYLYRDASNYKKWNECVIKGRITIPQIHEIMECCKDGMYFIPSQVGLPEEKFSDVTNDDHCWFELDEDGFSMTLCPAIENITTDELLSNFRKAKNNWYDWT